jgi:hypothetical protein
MIPEQVDRRVLGAVRFVDATTGSRVRAPLLVEAEGVRWIRNRRGWHVLATAPGLEAHTDAFRMPPATPAVGDTMVELTVRDPGRRYLPRRSSISLPRDPAPDHIATTSSLFQPVDVRLFPSSLAATAPGWAVIRASVTGEAPEEVLSGALIRVVRVSDETHLASGLSDERGEALVAIPGIPVTTWDEGNGEAEGEEEEAPVLATMIEVRLEVVFDPTAGPIPDPDALEARRDELRIRDTVLTLASGQVLALDV